MTIRLRVLRTEEQEVIEKLAHSRIGSTRLVERARIICAAPPTHRDHRADLAEALHCGRARSPDRPTARRMSSDLHAATGRRSHRDLANVSRATGVTVRLVDIGSACGVCA